MLASPPQRNAELRLRSTEGPLRTRVWWPPSAPAFGLLMCFVEAGDCSRLRELAASADLVVIAVPCAVLGDAPVRNAMTALEWAADHARELEADPDRLFVGGTGRGADIAAAAAGEARDQGWPQVALRSIEPGERA